MVDDLKKRGVPIDGIGLQMHTNLSVSDSNIVQAIQKLANTGLLIHISELDVCVNPKNDSAAQYTTLSQLRQAAKYGVIFGAYKNSVPAKQQFGITTWNVGDNDS